MVSKRVANLVQMHEFVWRISDGGIVAFQDRVESCGSGEFWHHCIHELCLSFNALGLCVLFDRSRSVADDEIALAN